MTEHATQFWLFYSQENHAFYARTVVVSAGSKAEAMRIMTAEHGGRRYSCIPLTKGEVPGVIVDLTHGRRSTFVDKGQP